MQCQSLFSGKNNKNISDCYLLKCVACLRSVKNILQSEGIGYKEKSLLNG